jgi:hypothetical protein
MKYIITESRLEKLIFKYLDSKLDGTEPMKGKYSDIVFGFPGETMGIMGIENPDWHGDPDWNSTLYIDSELYKDIILMFSLDWESTFDLIKKYVESRYNLEIDSVLFGDDQRIIK